jgi:WD40 repeat protein
VNCLDCSTDVGKIAAAYGKSICIFEPTPIQDSNTEHKLNYKWIKTAVLQADCYVSVISWNLEGTKLLTGGSCIQLWHLVSTDKNGNTKDLLNENGLNNCTSCNQQICKCSASGGLNFKWSNNEAIDEDSCSGQDSLRWACVWQCSTATNVCFLNFSPDGSLFVSAGKTDRLAKIWYRSAANHDYSGQSNIIGSEAMQKRLTSHVNLQNSIQFTFVYIVHPRAITGICWRKTSKYMPKSSVANMLVTSCKDNICRYVDLLS